MRPIINISSVLTISYFPTNSVQGIFSGPTRDHRHEAQFPSIQSLRPGIGGHWSRYACSNTFDSQHQGRRRPYMGLQGKEGMGPGVLVRIRHYRVGTLFRAANLSGVRHSVRLVRLSVMVWNPRGRKRGSRRSGSKAHTRVLASGERSSRVQGQRHCAGAWAAQGTRQNRPKSLGPGEFLRGPNREPG